MLGAFAVQLVVGVEAFVMTLKKRLTTLAVASALLSSCGVLASDDRQVFESLLSLIEEGESTVEVEKARYVIVRDDFVDCLVDYRDGLARPDVCETKRESLEKVLITTSSKFDFQELFAELQSLRLADSPEASRARDAFVSHLRAWEEYISDIRYAMPTTEEIYGMNYSFINEWVSINDSSRITSTFDEVCSALGNAQPENSDEYRARVIDICDD
ncbi:MAG: hypothetical protein EBS61_06270 [Betaproteobacteria bacterium]|nr:hypothetical protein [Betaproteobacteria bacterium]